MTHLQRPALECMLAAIFAALPLLAQVSPEEIPAPSPPAPLRQGEGGNGLLPPRPSLWIAPCRVLSVTDGDTLSLVIAVTPRVRVLESVRVSGVDTPELSTPAGRPVRECVRMWVREHVCDEAVWIGADGRFDFSVQFVASDKYAGRFVGELRDAQGESLGDWLLAAGLAQAYAGGARPEWTPHQIERAASAALTILEPAP